MFTELNNFLNFEHESAKFLIYSITYHVFLKNF
jgi:hypothetical protein